MCPRAYVHVCMNVFVSVHACACEGHAFVSMCAYICAQMCIENETHSFIHLNHFSFLSYFIKCELVLRFVSFNIFTTFI